MVKIQTIIISSLIFVAFSLPHYATAEEIGVLPGSFSYGIVTVLEKVNLWFTFNPEKKARKALHYADKRIAEVQGIADTGNAETVKAVLSQYEKHLALARDSAAKIDDDDAENQVRALIDESTSRHRETLAEVVTIVPEGAQQAIEHALDKIDVAPNAGTSDSAKAVDAPELPDRSVEDTQASTPTIPERSVTETIIPAPVQSDAQPRSETITVTLPNGAIVETDSDGNILRYVKDPPPPLPSGSAITPAQPPTDTTSALKITSVAIKPEIDSVDVEWTTNLPTDSKVFLSGPSMSTRVFHSASGRSARHIVTINGLLEGVTYSYEIEAVHDSSIATRLGALTTKTREPLIFLSQPTPVLYSTSGIYNLADVEFKTNRPAKIVWHWPGTQFNRLCNPDTGTLNPRTRYTCDLTVQDEYEHTATANFDVVTGPGYLRVINNAGIYGLTGTMRGVIDFKNNDPSSAGVQIQPLAFSVNLSNEFLVMPDAVLRLSDSANTAIAEIPVGDAEQWTRTSKNWVEYRGELDWIGKIETSLSLYIDFVGISATSIVGQTIVFTLDFSVFPDDVGITYMNSQVRALKSAEQVTIVGTN